MIPTTILGLVSVLALISPALSLPLQTSQDTTTSTRSSGLSASTNIPSYVMELYDRLSSLEPETMTLQQRYNTIRSLETISSDCTDNLVYQFVFDVSAIADDEAVLQSTLRVYFENSQSIASATRSKDSILATLGYSNGTSVTSKSLYGTSSQWVEFEVGSSVDDWRALKIPLDFTIQLDYLRDNGPHTNIGCDDSTFSLVSDSHSDTNKHALLVVYTDQANMDIFKGLEAAMETKARETRSVSQPGTLAGPSRCGPKTEVLVGKDWLNNIFKPYSFEMLLPNNIELNVCGGNCDNNLSNAPHHAALLSEYISDPAHSVQSQFQKCCVPIEYTAMVILTRRTITVGQTTLKLERIEDATASRCGCIYTYNSTQT